MKGQKITIMIENKHRDNVARALSNPLFHQRIVKSKKIYSRKKLKKGGRDYKKESNIDSFYFDIIKYTKYNKQ